MCGKVRESGLTEIVPLMCTSALWGRCPVLSHPESPQGHRGGSCSGCRLRGHYTLCLLIRQLTFFVHSGDFPSLPRSSREIRPARSAR